MMVMQFRMVRIRNCAVKENKEKTQNHASNLS